MEINLFRLITFLCFCVFINLSSTSIVYNLRVAETTKRQSLSVRAANPEIAAITLFDQFRKQRNGTTQSVIGGLGTLIHSPQKGYLRVDFAIANVHEKYKDYRFSKTETDDVLISFGYSHAMNERFKMTLSGLFGVPMHGDSILQDGIMFGTGHLSLGTQLDSMFAYSKNLKHSIISAARIIHFFKRRVSIKANNQLNFFDYNLGNLLDILISHYSIWGQKHTLEAGYNLTALFDANITPNVKDVVLATNFVQSSFYASYSYSFLIDHIKSALILGMSCGFGHLANQFRTTYAFSFWLGLGINF